MSLGSAPVGALVGFVTTIVPLGPAPVYKAPDDAIMYEISESAENKRLGFKALAKIDRDELESRGFEIVTKPHDHDAAEVVGLPPPGDPLARWVASELLSALEIIRPPTPEELAALRREWEGAR